LLFISATASGKKKSSPFKKFRKKYYVVLTTFIHSRQGKHPFEKTLKDQEKIAKAE